MRKIQILLCIQIDAKDFIKLFLSLLKTHFKHISEIKRQNNRKNLFKSINSVIKWINNEWIQQYLKPTKNDWKYLSFL